MVTHIEVLYDLFEIYLAEGNIYKYKLVKQLQGKLFFEIINNKFGICIITVDDKDDSHIIGDLF